MVGAALTLAAPACQPAATGPDVDALGPFEGTYALTGHAASNGCGRDMYLAARHLVVKPAARTLFADVVNRTYDARAQGDRLVAEGRFLEPQCRSSEIVERWVLARGPNGALSGTLESSWQVAPDCATRCSTTYTVSATPASAGALATP